MIRTRPKRKQSIKEKLRQRIKKKRALQERRKEEGRPPPALEKFQGLQQELPMPMEAAHIYQTMHLYVQMQEIFFQFAHINCHIKNTYMMQMAIRLSNTKVGEIYQARHLFVGIYAACCSCSRQWWRAKIRESEAPRWQSCLFHPRAWPTHSSPHINRICIKIKSRYVQKAMLKKTLSKR